MTNSKKTRGASPRSKRPPAEPGTLIRVNQRGVVSLPKSVRGEAKIFSALVRDDGVIELHPKMLIDESQAWFWTERWQAMEREAQADIDAGRVTHYDSAEEMIADLERYAQDVDKRRS